MPCLFRLITGLYCPGCGGTRAVKAFLTGHLVLSFLYHPIVLYVALLAVRFAVSYLLYWKTGDRRYRIFLENKYIYTAVALTVANFLIKNFLLVVMGIDILERLPKV